MDNELPILVPNKNSLFFGWLPWHYEGIRKCHHKTIITGGEKKAKAHVEGWSGEIFIPFALFKGFGNTPPIKGTEWKANFYRMDYYNGNPARWAWCTETGVEFHDFKKFGSIVFN